MMEGFHTIKSGFSSDYNNMVPRLHRMDNGDYQSNFFLRDVQLIPQNNPRSGSNQDNLSAETIFFVIATTELGAIPQTANAGDLTMDDFDLRLSDNRQIAWGVIALPRDIPRWSSTRDTSLLTTSTSICGHSLRPDR